MKLENCEVCESSEFMNISDSILIQRYEFITKENLVMCKKCGGKYQICSNCKKIMNRVHISLDIFDIKIFCSICKKLDVKVQSWCDYSSTQL